MMRISWKIFGVALIVFVVMAASSIYTIIKIFEINKELASISDVFIPLTNELTKIDTIILNEELHVERVEKIEAELRGDRLEGISDQFTKEQITTAIKSDPALSERLTNLKQRLSVELTIFEQRAQEVEQLIRHSEGVIKDAQQSLPNDADRLALAELYPSLVAIEGQHGNYHTHAKTIVETEELTGNIREKLENQLEEEGEKLSVHMEAVREQIAGFTEKSIQTAALHEQQAFYASIGFTASAGLLALILSYLVITGILRPMRALTDGAKRVQEGDLTVHIEPRSTDEIGSLTVSFNQMIEGLRSTEKIKETFGQYLDPRVVSSLLGDNASVTGGEKKVISAYFSDLADFSTVSEQFTPSGLIQVLNRYLDLMSVPITDRSGVIDKYIGDAIMAFWAPPFCPEGDQATLAVKTALFNIKVMDTFQSELPDLTGLRQNLPIIRQRIGIATGDAVIGSVGSEKTKNYTVMGDTVNLGSRLEGANKAYGTDILLCERTRNMAQDVEFRLVDRIQVLGKTEATKVYTPLCEASDLTDVGREIQGLSDEALQNYVEQNWQKAQSKFSEILTLSPDDRIASMFINRIDLIKEQGAPADWDGIWRMTTK
ncbi:MAG: adenylate/guanylate cyclase domain-containing protein [Stappiaceae bacterium]